MSGFDSDQAEILRRLPWLLGERRRELEQADEAYRDAVRDLVLAGYSWADVGRMLGVTRQSARERFGAGVAEWREHMGDRMPWDEFGDALWGGGLSDDEMGEHLSNMAGLHERGPVEDRR